MSARLLRRFCFRREMIGPPPQPLTAAAARLARSATSRRIRRIWEVVLTGGDPLLLSARRAQGR
jgi:lysine 2,3-aminomutase